MEGCLMLNSLAIDSGYSELSVEELMTKRDEKLHDLDDKLIEMQTDIELLYQLKKNEVIEFFDSLIERKNSTTV